MPREPEASAHTGDRLDARPGAARRVPNRASSADAAPDRPRSPPGPDEVARGAALLGVPLTPSQLAQLEAYLDLLQRWGRTYNLTAILDRPAMRVQHLLDSLALVPHLPHPPHPSNPSAIAAQPHPAAVAAAGEQRAARPPVLLDVGSGAGLPGVVVAIARPDWRVVCVDAVAKKVGFIRQVAAELRLPNLLASHTRIEALAQQADWPVWAPQGAQVITSRAFASLSDFLGATQALRASDGEWLAMKGQVPEVEIRQLRSGAGDAVFKLASGLNIETIALQVPGLDAQRCLVRVGPGGSPEAPAAG